MNGDSPAGVVGCFFYGHLNGEVQRGLPPIRPIVEIAAGLVPIGTLKHGEGGVVRGGRVHVGELGEKDLVRRRKGAVVPWVAHVVGASV